MAQTGEPKEYFLFYDMSSLVFTLESPLEMGSQDKTNY